METNLKYIIVTMPDQSVWKIPADFVARSYASYYSEVDKDTTYEKEYNYIYNNDIQLIDWAQCNMDWNDFKDIIDQVENPRKSDYSQDWFKATMVIMND
jgi:hypothetical protein